MKKLLSYEEVRSPKKPRPKKGVTKINLERGGERFPHRRQPEYVSWFHSMRFPCVCLPQLTEKMVAAIGTCRGVVEAAHVKSRGAAGDDVDNLVPLCEAHHRKLHAIGQRTFEFHLGEKLRHIAKRIGNLFYLDRGLR